MILRNVKLATLLITVTAVGIPLITYFIFNTTFLETITFAQAIFSVLALVFIIYTLHISIYTLRTSLLQLNKTMAKPIINVTFSEDELLETTLDLLKDRSNQKELEIWVNNNGNSVARCFQIDIDVPKLLNQPLALAATKTGFRIRDQEEKATYFFCNDADDPLFVNMPKTIGLLPIELSHNDYHNYPEKLDVKYRVYGDWAETQEGILTVYINKQ